MSPRRKQGRKIFYKSNKSRCTTVNSHVNSNESNNLNTSNSDNVIGNSNLMKKVIDAESGVSINDGILY